MSCCEKYHAEHKQCWKSALHRVQAATIEIETVIPQSLPLLFKMLHTSNTIS